MEEQGGRQGLEHCLRLVRAVRVLDDHEFEERADDGACRSWKPQIVRRICVAARLEEKIKNGRRGAEDRQEIAVEEFLLDQHADDDSAVVACLPQRVAAERLADVALAFVHGHDIVPSVADGLVVVRVSVVEKIIILSVKALLEFHVFQHADHDVIVRVARPEADDFLARAFRDDVVFPWQRAELRAKLVEGCVERCLLGLSFHEDTSS